MLQPHEVATVPAPGQLSSCGHACAAATGLSLGLLHMGERHRDTGLIPEEVRRFNFWESLSPKAEKSPRAKARAAGVSWRASATARLQLLLVRRRCLPRVLRGRRQYAHIHTARTTYYMCACASTQCWRVQRGQRGGPYASPTPAWDSCTAGYFACHRAAPAAGGGHICGVPQCTLRR